MAEEFLALSMLSAARAVIISAPVTAAARASAAPQDTTAKEAAEAKLRLRAPAPLPPTLQPRSAARLEICRRRAVAAAVCSAARATVAPEVQLPTTEMVVRAAELRFPNLHYLVLPVSAQ